MFSFIIGAAIGSLICYLILREKLKVKAAIDEHLFSCNKALAEKNEELSNIKFDLELELKNYEAAIDFRKDTIDLFNRQIDDKKSMLESLEQTIDEKTKSIEIIFNNAKEECEHEYLVVLQDWMKNYQSLVQKYKAEITDYKNQIADYKNKQDTIIENLKREEELREKDNFYKIIILPENQKDITLLREIGTQLKNKEVLNKVVWKSYFEKPTNDMISRVVGAETVSGVYKITNPAENKAYIGQAVDIAARFKQHIKRGLGAEAPLNNKFYPALEHFGVENFTFEILEKCKREELNEKEKFWIDYYNTKIYGYNVTGGGS